MALLLTIFQTVCLLWYKTLLHTTLETLMTFSPFMLILICSTTLSFPLLFVLGIPEDIKQATYVASFKYRLNKDIKKPPKYYIMRIGQILQARMRMECSSLNSQLYRKNIGSTPSCQYGCFDHFFFQCPRYAASRNRFLPNDINRYNTHDFLFGIKVKQTVKTRPCL